MLYLLIFVVSLLIILLCIYSNKNMQEISKNILLKSGLDDNITICRKMLKMLENNHTKVEYNQDENSNLSYYNHTKDVVVIKRKEDNFRIINIAHECIHTIQNRKFLNANKFFSDFQMIYFLFALIFIIITQKFELELIFVQLLILLGTVFVKVVIEGDASYRAIILSEKYLESELGKQEAEEYSLACGNIIYETMAMYYINFLLQGSFMLIVNMIIAIFV